MSRAWARGSTAAWRRLRAQVLLANQAENQGRCQVAIPGTWLNAKGETVQCLGVADCVHHRVGRAVSGDDPRFLVACCTPCNLHIGEPKSNSPQHKRVSEW